MVHGFGIDKKLKGGAGLALGGHFVVFPRLEINVAHPGLYGTCLRLHGYHRTVHERHHVFDGVLRCHILGDGALVVVEQLHRMHPLLIIVADGVGVVGVSCLQRLVERLTLGNLVDEAGYLVAVLIAPRRHTHPVLVLVAEDAPVVVEVVLHLLHLLHGSLLGVFLHPRIERGVDLQTGAVEVVAILFTPVLEIVGNGLAEVHGLTVVVLLHLEVEFDGQFLERVAGGFREVAMRIHIRQHHIAAALAVLWIGLWIIHRRGLQHTDEHCAVLRRETVG